MHKIMFILSFVFLFVQCNNDSTDSGNAIEYPQVYAKFSGKIDLAHLDNYAQQTIPTYITKDNTGANSITDKGATLGRVLFYDKELSVDRTKSCSSCHQQNLAFTDSDIQSKGVNGNTQRHSMRLVNNRFSQEVRYFWDERANTLENQTTQPIKDHSEMGFSGANGDLTFSDLVARLSAIGYYQELFTFVFGDAAITENRIQLALSQFVRSIQSFDSKYDLGRAQVANDGAPFPNFTNQENLGKNIFLSPPVFNATGNRVGGGAGCAGCHRPPEFDIDPNTRNNGIIGNLNGGIDITNTKAPTLRDVLDPNGNLNSALMHTANFTTLQSAILHYNTITIATGNTNLDPRLTPNGVGQNLQLSAQEVAAISSFIATLTGKNVYTDTKWSSPF